MAFSLLVSLLLASSVSVEHIEDLKLREEKGWIREQDAELRELQELKRTIEDEIAYQKEIIQQISLDIIDRRARPEDLLPYHMNLQYLVYELHETEEEIERLKCRKRKGLFGELLARKKKSEAEAFDYYLN